jgi:hypothetical protein
MSKAADGDVIISIKRVYRKNIYFKELNLRLMASHLCAGRCHACPAITVTFKSTDDSDPIILGNIFCNFVI